MKLLPYVEKLHELANEENLPCVELFDYTNNIFQNASILENYKFEVF